MSVLIAMSGEERGQVLKTVLGTIFAPEGFSEHVTFESTGIVSYSTLREIHPHNLSMIIDFMKHFEFCLEVKFKKQEKSISAESTPYSQLEVPVDSDDKEIMARKHYLFPALIRNERPEKVWKESDIERISYHCGWYICTLPLSKKPQFLTERFLHVMLFRLAFSFAFKASRESSQVAIQRKCQMWKNGIWWSKNGIAVQFEVIEHRQVAVLIMACLRGYRMKCTQLRSELIHTILQAKRELSPTTPVQEFVMYPSNPADPSKLSQYNRLFSLAKLSDSAYSIPEMCTAFSKREDFREEPDTVFSESDSIGMSASELLYFEPYANVFSIHVMKQLLDKDKKTEEIPEECAESIHSDILVRQLQEVFKPYPGYVYSTFTENAGNPFMQCDKILKLWKDEKLSCEHTFQSFRHEIDRYSIFRERDPMVSIVSACKNM